MSPNRKSNNSKNRTATRKPVSDRSRTQREERTIAGRPFGIVIDAERTWRVINDDPVLTEGRWADYGTSSTCITPDGFQVEWVPGKVEVRNDLGSALLCWLTNRPGTAHGQVLVTKFSQHQPRRALRKQDIKVVEDMLRSRMHQMVMDEVPLVHHIDETELAWGKIPKFVSDTSQGPEAAADAMSQAINSMFPWLGSRSSTLRTLTSDGIMTGVLLTERSGQLSLGLALRDHAPRTGGRSASRTVVALTILVRSIVAPHSWQATTIGLGLQDLSTS